MYTYKYNMMYMIYSTRSDYYVKLGIMLTVSVIRGNITLEVHND